MPHNALRGRSFVSVDDLSNKELAELLDLALALKQRTRAGITDHPLKGKTLGLVFQKPSLRTRASFEVAMRQLGGDSMYLSPAEVGMGQREAVDDVALVLSRYFDAIAARVFGHDVVATLAQHATVPVINALSDGEHPCQALADLLTLLEWKGDLTGLTVAYVGDGNNVAASLALACAKVGTHFAIATPEGYELSAAAVDRFQAAARDTGAELRQTHDPEAAVSDAQAIYTDVWTSMGQEAEKEKRLRDFAGFKVTEALRAQGDDAIVLHCLPAHYGEEIDRDVTRGPHSAIWDQAENRLHAQKALLASLLA